MAPPRRGGWPSGWERAPGHTSRPASTWPLSVPTVLTSLDTCLEPGRAPYRHLSPGRGTPQGLDLGQGTLHSQLCTHRSRDLEQVSQALRDPAVDRVCPHTVYRAIRKAADSCPPGREPVMAALSQHRRNGVPPVSLPGPRGLRLSRPFPAAWAPPGRVTWRDGGGGGSSPGTAAWTESGPRVTWRGEGPTSPHVQGGGSSISPLRAGLQMGQVHRA